MSIDFRGQQKNNESITEIENKINNNESNKILSNQSTGLGSAVFEV